MVSSEEKDKDLAEQLMEAGKRVMALPSSVHELLPALNQLDYCLSKVDQSPSLPILKALCLSMEALLIDDLLRHQDVDVKAYMAVCISEVTRITAPEPPYNDNQMKEFFLLIVSAFEKLADISSRSYRKRVLTLELMAKVRSCLLMVDLGCDALILDMFQYFLKSIRNNHPETVFSSMETIMTLVLEESDNISQELLTPLLAAVEIENKSVLFIQRKLAEKVLENCASKLKPYLSLAVRTMGISVNDYSKIVSFICQGTSDPIIYRHINGPVEHTISGPPHSVKDFGDNLIGSTIKVWWPLDKKFYEGVIDSFDPVKQKHKVLYLDGDKETLNLKTERWEFILDNSADRASDEENKK